MSFQNILIPTDGSEFMDNTIENGLRIAKLSGGRITALYVLDQSVYSNMPMDSAVVNIYETLEKEGEEAIEHIRKMGEKEGVEVIGKMIEGMPPKVIVHLSEEYDLIVMGTAGKKGMTKLLLGSVAEKVVEMSKCPVMIVSSLVKTNA